MSFITTFNFVTLAVAAFYSVAVVSVVAAVDLADIKELTPQRIRDGNDHRNLQIIPNPFPTVPTCNDYQFIVEIDDDLRMSYVVMDDRLKVELEYDNEDWIALGTNPEVDGRKIGGEAWVALPDINNSPVIYNLNSYFRAGVRVADDQTLENGSILQFAGSTVMRFEKLLDDGANVPINAAGEVVFIWAIGRGNDLGYHSRDGAFRLTLEKCNDPELDKDEVALDVVCGFFGMNLFCPTSGCGFFGRMLGLC